MQTQIVFTRQGSSSTLGNFEPGTVARVSEALARHFVEINVARYATAPASAPAPSAPRQRRGKRQ